MGTDDASFGFRELDRSPHGELRADRDPLRTAGRTAGVAWTIETAAVEHCPTCGAPLGSRETPDGTRLHCSDCDLTVYRNPVPMGRATVVGGDSLLLVELGVGCRRRATRAVTGGRPRRAPRSGPRGRLRRGRARERS